MDTVKIAQIAAGEIAETAGSVNEGQLQSLIEAVCRSKKIYVTGAGRSLLMMRSIAMRLMHLGFECYVVGDTTTPAFEEGDLLLLASGSGETRGLINIVQKAKLLGGTIAVMTISRSSSLGQLADVLIEIPAYTAKVDYEGMKCGILPSGSLFEQSVLVIGDSLVVPLAERKHINCDGEFLRHANLE